MRVLVLAVALWCMQEQMAIPPEAVTDGHRVNVVGPDGWVGSVPVENLKDALLRGYRLETREEALARRDAKVTEEGRNHLLWGALVAVFCVAMSAAIAVARRTFARPK